ncbi:MAG: MFS transporter, partial [Oscillospiraceae bacterium]
SKASGMVSLAGSARYLVSPVLAGALLTVSDIKLLLIIDICTFFPTVFAAAFIKKEIASKQTEKDVSFAESLKIGGKAVTGKRGVLVLTVVSSLITCFMGVFQILAQPLILDFADSATLGTAETICACGMVVSGVILGAAGIKKGYVKILSVSLFFAGIGMAGFGVWENIFVICIFGFIFFAMLPFANSCLDYLVRTNIADELQGRAWGLIGFISQLGYVVAYALAGAAADGISAHTGISVGRGAAQVIIISGVLLCASALLMYSLKSVRSLEATEYDKKADIQ